MPLDAPVMSALAVLPPSIRGMAPTPVGAGAVIPKGVRFLAYWQSTPFPTVRLDGNANRNNNAFF
jgi:hypothetical protein